MAVIGVCLAGCGNQDGSEIHEATLTLLSLVRHQHRYFCFAPDIEQTKVIDHSRHEPMAEKRRVLVESARIARGEIKDIKKVSAAQFDALVFPGGMGAALNLSNYGEAGARAVVQPDVQRLIHETFDARKPIVAICIAPAMLVAALRGKAKLTVTLGDDPTAAKNVEAMGAIHQRCPAEDCVADEQNRVITTPAYMLAKNIGQVADGIEAAVARLSAWLK